MKTFKYVSCLVLLMTLGISCVEKISIPEETVDSFQPILAVEATLTNEFKKHQIILSLTNPIGDAGLEQTLEGNAQVTIEEDGNIRLFEEIENWYLPINTTFSGN